MDRKGIERHRIVRFPLENYAGIVGYEEKDSDFCKKWRESYYSIWALKKAQLDYYVCCWILIRLRCLLASKRKELRKQFGILQTEAVKSSSLSLSCARTRCSYSDFHVHDEIEIVWTCCARLRKSVRLRKGTVLVVHWKPYNEDFRHRGVRDDDDDDAHGCTDSRWNLLRLLAHSRLLSIRFLSRFLCRDIDRRRSRSSRRSVRCPYHCLYTSSDGT